MPFLNDLLEQTRRDASSSAALNAENCHTRTIVETHLRSEDTLQSRFRFDVAAVMQVLRSEVLGQDEALQAIEDVLTVVRADILDPRRPLFTALFLGPTGVGKTEIVLLALVRRRLVKRFSAEFVNRIDSTVVFNAIEQEVSERIVELEVSRLNRRLAKHHCRLQLDAAVVGKLASEGHDVEFGARALKRFIRHELEVPLAEYLLGNRIPCRAEVACITVAGHLERGRIRFSVPT